MWFDTFLMPLGVTDVFANLFFAFFLSALFVISRVRQSVAGPSMTADRNPSSSLAGSEFVVDA